MSHDPSTQSHLAPDHSHHHHPDPNLGHDSHDQKRNEASDHHGHSGHGNNAGHSDHGHGGHAGHGDHVGQFRRLFWIMLVLAVPVVAFNEMFADLIGYQIPEAEWVWWVSPILGTVMYAWGEIGRAHV